MSVTHEQGLAKAQTPDEYRLLAEIDAAYSTNAWSTLAIYARALDDAIYARRQREAVMVPFIGQTRTERPRTGQDVRVAPLHRTCGSYHHMGTECPPGQPAPGSDGDTRDWPTETMPAVSHAPAVCTCARTITWRTDGVNGWWAHIDESAPLDHDVYPRE